MANKYYKGHRNAQVNEHIKESKRRYRKKRLKRTLGRLTPKWAKRSLPRLKMLASWQRIIFSSKAIDLLGCVGLLMILVVLAISNSISTITHADDASLQVDQVNPRLVNSKQTSDVDVDSPKTTSAGVTAVLYSMIDDAIADQIEQFDEAKDEQELDADISVGDASIGINTTSSVQAAGTDKEIGEATQAEEITRAEKAKQAKEATQTKEDTRPNYPIWMG